MPGGSASRPRLTCTPLEGRQTRVVLTERPSSFVVGGKGLASAAGAADARKNHSQTLEQHQLLQNVYPFRGVSKRVVHGVCKREQNILTQIT